MNITTRLRVERSGFLYGEKVREVWEVSYDSKSRSVTYDVTVKRGSEKQVLEHTDVEHNDVPADLKKAVADRLEEVRGAMP